MTVSFLKHVALEIPQSDLNAAAAFYTDFGLEQREGDGVLFHVEAIPPETPVAQECEFKINSPGHYHRTNAAVLPPKSSIPDPCPRKLGHILLFTPDVEASLDFLIRILGMRLSDRSQDIVAFAHCQGGSDHHVIALAKSAGIGFHHAIGSNFFHYIRDPWGSYVEYYADIDYIADSDAWEPTNWPLEDSLHAWGPNPPRDMVHNYEID